MALGRKKKIQNVVKKIKEVVKEVIIKDDGDIVVKLNNSIDVKDESK